MRHHPICVLINKYLFIIVCSIIISRCEHIFLDSCTNNFYWVNATVLLWDECIFFTLTKCGQFSSVLVENTESLLMISFWISSQLYDARKCHILWYLTSFVYMLLTQDPLLMAKSLIAQLVFPTETSRLQISPSFIVNIQFSKIKKSVPFLCFTVRSNIKLIIPYKTQTVHSFPHQYEPHNFFLKEFSADLNSQFQSWSGKQLRSIHVLCNSNILFHCDGEQIRKQSLKG